MRLSASCEDALAGHRIGTASASASATNTNASVPAATILNFELPKNSASAIFIAVFESTPTAMAVAATVGDSACATSLAIDNVSASTSVRPSTAADVNTPDAPQRSRATYTAMRT